MNCKQKGKMEEERRQAEMREEGEGEGGPWAETQPLAHVTQRSAPAPGGGPAQREEEQQSSHIRQQCS